MAEATAFDPAPAAQLLADWRGARRIVEKLPPALAPGDVAEGAAVQKQLAIVLGAMPPAGFKIGATSKTMQDYLGLAGPAAGFMAARSVHASGATLRYADYLGAGVECEIAVRLAADLPAGPCDDARAKAAVGAVFTAIEVVERRYGDLATVGVPTVIGDQVFHAACVLGSPVADWQELDLAALPGRITVDGVVRGGGVGADLLGHPMNALAWLAGSEVAAAFGGLRAGQVVLLGSVTPPIWLDGPATASVAFEGLPPVGVTLT